MFNKRQSPHWLKKLLELGKAKPSHSDVKKRAYRTSSQRFFWGLAGIFAYFLMGVYLLGGGSGSSDNSGIFSLIFGAIIVGGLVAFLAPRLNDGIERLLPSGRRKQEDLKKKQARRSPSSQRSSRSGSIDSLRSSRTHSNQSKQSDQSDPATDKTGR